jgi:Hydrazine synthase alpha subunit middle domain
MRYRAILLFLIVLFCLVKVIVSTAEKRSLALLYTQAEQYDGNAWMHGGERFSKSATIYQRDASGTRPLISGFASTADPNISFDGESVIFAGKKLPGDPWQIWEIGLAPGSQLRRIVSASDDLLRPMYLPGDRVVYARKINGHYTIEVSSIDGAHTQRLFPLAVDAFPTDVLQDGRILFMSGYPLGERLTPELYTMYSDGSGVESYRCDHGGARSYGKQISSGDVVFATPKGLARFTSASAKELAAGLPPADYAGDISEITPDEWLVPWRASKRSFYVIGLKRRRTGSLISFLAASGKHLLQPVVIAPRPTPKKHPSALHEWNTSNLLTLSVYTTKNQPLPNHVASVRLYTKNPADQVITLGSAPIEKDGSFYITVPGDRALQFELLDAGGKTIRKQQGWFWIAKGEQRVCVGCHAGPERAPDNDVPQILLRSTTPTNLAESESRAQSGGH